MEVVTEDLDYNNLLNVSAINHSEVVYDLRNIPVHVRGHSPSLISTPATNLDINWLPETINKAEICQEAFNTVDDIKEWLCIMWWDEKVKNFRPLLIIIETFPSRK